jgi:N-acetylmuramoyl-L-alanine amidase
LRERILAAEARDADAFISIHINAARSSKVKGAEVFFLSLKGATDEASREVARLENLGRDFDSFPLDEELKDLPFGIDLRQSATLERSSLLAESVLGSFEKEGLAASRGVKQARFIVLKSIRIPSVLVELGFISNQQELKRLRDPSYRQKLAEVLEDGILEYIRRYAPQRNP